MLPPLEHAWIDASQAPLYQVTYTPAGEEELREYCAIIERWHARIDEPFAVVLDLRRVAESTAKQRQILSEHDRRIEQTSVLYNVGLALIINNPLIRGYVTAVQWLAPPKYPHKTFATREPAIAWAREQLQQASRLREKSRHAG